MQWRTGLLSWLNSVLCQSAGNLPYFLECHDSPLLRQCVRNVFWCVQSLPCIYPQLWLFFVRWLSAWHSVLRAVTTSQIVSSRSVQSQTLVFSASPGKHIAFEKEALSQLSQKHIDCNSSVCIFLILWRRNVVTPCTGGVAGALG